MAPQAAVSPVLRVRKGVHQQELTPRVWGHPSKTLAGTARVPGPPCSGEPATSLNLEAQAGREEGKAGRSEEREEVGKAGHGP